MNFLWDARPTKGICPRSLYVFKDNLIENVTITQTNSEFKLSNSIVAEKANISKKIWELNDVKVIDKIGQNKNYINLMSGQSYHLDRIMEFQKVEKWKLVMLKLILNISTQTYYLYSWILRRVSFMKQQRFDQQIPPYYCVKLI